MSVTSIRPCYNIDAALAYQEAKDGIDRCAMESSNAELMSFRDINKKLKIEHGRMRQGYTIIQSFPKDELDYTDEADIEQAHLLGVELASSQFPNTIFNVVTHTDSKGHCVHNHITVLNHDFSTQKALQNTTWFQLKHTNDKLMNQYGMEICKEKRRSLDSAEYWAQQREQDTALWQDDLRSRIDKAIMKAIDLSSLQDNLAVEGVNGLFFKKDGRELLKHFSFTFTDENGKEHRKRGDKMGTQYSKQNILSQLAANNKQKEAPKKQLESMSDWIKRQPPKAAPQQKAVEPKSSVPEKASKKVERKSDDTAELLQSRQKQIRKNQAYEEEKQKRIIMEINRRLQELDEEMDDETLDEDSPKYKKLQAEYDQLQRQHLQLAIEKTEEIRRQHLLQHPQTLNEDLMPRQRGDDQYGLEF